MKKTLFQSDKHVPVLEIPATLEGKWKLYTALRERARVQLGVLSFNVRTVPFGTKHSWSAKKICAMKLEVACATLWCLIHQPQAMEPVPETRKFRL